MFRLTDETKVLRDPVHGYIHVDYEAVWRCINSAWFQRLRRIRQLGGAGMVYHTADHTRFSHSLGVYEIVRRMVTEVPDIAKALDEKEKLTAMLAGLMHDIGHGPYSHAFEAVSGTSHEEYTCRIIEEDPEIRGILEATAPGLAKDVADVIRHRSADPILSQLVSSQLDADRMDYLLRDAYFTGTTYGEFDLERILRVLRVSDGVIVVKESGIYAIENYIMARYHMYWQVYYHPTARSSEFLLRSLFRRLKDLDRLGQWPDTLPEFRPVVQKKKLTLDQYFVLDEYACGYGFMRLMEAEDPVVRDLADRVVNRRLFEYSENEPVKNRKIRALLKKNGFDLKYYFLKDEVDQRPYVPYKGMGSQSIMVQMHTGEVLELSQASNIVSSLVGAPLRSDNRVYYPLCR